MPTSYNVLYDCAYTFTRVSLTLTSTNTLLCLSSNVLSCWKYPLMSDVPAAILTVARKYIREINGFRNQILLSVGIYLRYFNIRMSAGLCSQDSNYFLYYLQINFGKVCQTGIFSLPLVAEVESLPIVSLIFP